MQLNCKLSSAKYAWLIGNDDLILPETLSYLKILFMENTKLIIFINSYLLNSKYLKNFKHPFDTFKLDQEKMKKFLKLI